MTQTAPLDITTARKQGLPELVHRSAMRYPGKVAIINGDKTLTYAELDGAIESTATALAQQGLVKGDRLAVLARNSWQYAVLYFATARLGVLIVPINFMLKPSEVAYILGHSEPRAVVADEGELLHTMNAALGEVGLTPISRGVIGSGEHPEGWASVTEWTTTPPEQINADVHDDDPIRIMYTSGTESAPKGALMSSRSLIAQYVSCIVAGDFSSDDVSIQSLPLYHCAQLDCMLIPELYLGSTTVILSAPEPNTVLATMEKYGVTKYFAPPTVWISLLRNPKFDDYDVSSLRKGYYGASPMPVEVLRELQQRLPNVDLWNFYGQTEMAPAVATLPPHEQERLAGSTGWPVLNVETKIVGPDGGELPRGEMGEIVHRSPQAFLGYYKNPEKTAEAFTDGWFHSGDLGIMTEEGAYTVVDRKKDMVKSGGENVASREVEEAIYGHPAVAEVAVFALPHPKWVEAVTAAVVVKDGQELTGETLKEWMGDHVAHYKIPKNVIIVDELPKNPSGKILKRQLRTEYTESGYGQDVE